MKAKYCKVRNMYITEKCKGCDNIECGQGIGSLVGQGNSSINQVTNERTITNQS